MKTENIVDLAIKRHDLDATWFQKQYQEDRKEIFNPFSYGRQQVLDELSEVLKQLPKGANILDVGCGTGHLAHWMQQQGFTVTGVEPSEEMLKYAKSNFPQIEFIKSLSSNIPLGANSFDLIISFEVLRYLNREENVKTYNEYYRLLKPGGKMFVTHVNRYASDFYYVFYNFRKLLTRMKGKVYHNCYFTTGATEEKLLKEAGFSKAVSLGIMNASLRIAYKLGKGYTRFHRWVLSKFSPREKFTGNPSKSMAGHLILIATK